MSKQVKDQRPATSAKKPSEQNEVEKVVNQRYTNGKKQYKVIWKGRSFEQAAWVEEQKLNCPQKIKEFQKRYQEVMKKKNMLSKIEHQASSTIKSESNPKSQPKKLTLEKPQTGTQQKITINQSTGPNKEKVQTTLNKNGLASQKKSTQNSQNPGNVNKNKSNGIFQKGLNEPQIENFSNLSQKNTTEANTRIQKMIEKLPKAITYDQKLKNKSTLEVKSNNFIQDYEQEETAQSDQNYEAWNVQKIFINYNERLQIQTIKGLVMDFEGDIKQKGTQNNSNEIDGKKNSPKFFLVKNRFTVQERLVERQRAVMEQPLKVIQFYERIIQEGKA